MALRAAHGKGRAALVRVETLPADELPDGVQADGHAEARSERWPNGRWKRGAQTAQSRGGRALKQQTALAHRLGLTSVANSNGFGRYRTAARRFAKAQARDLRRLWGGGELSSAAQSMVASAALALAASRYLSDRAAAGDDDTELLAQAVAFADKSRQALLTAHELAAREGAARARLTAARAEQAKANQQRARLDELAQLANAHRADLGEGEPAHPTDEPDDG